MDKLERYVDELHATLDHLPVSQVEAVIARLEEARSLGRTVFIMGNGGSAATASHFVCDLAKNTRREGLPLFRVVGLADNMPIFSAYANDEGYDTVFAQQLANLVSPGDVVIGISTSGRSANVVKALELAKAHGAFTVGFTGFDGGRVGQIVDLHVHVASDRIEHVEDVHLMLEHMITSSLRESDAPTPARWLDTARKPFPVPASGASERWFAFGRGWRNSRTAHLAARSEEKSTIHELLRRMLLLAAEGLGAPSGCGVLLDGDGRAATGIIAYKGHWREVTSEDLAETLDRGLAGWVVQNRQPALVESTQDDPRWVRRAWEGEDQPSRSAISVPVTVNDRPVVVLTLVHPTASFFTGEDLALLTALAAGLAALAGQSENAMPRGLGVPAPR